MISKGVTGMTEDVRREPALYFGSVHVLVLPIDGDLKRRPRYMQFYSIGMKFDVSMSH